MCFSSSRTCIPLLSTKQNWSLSSKYPSLSIQYVLSRIVIFISPLALVGVKFVLWFLRTLKHSTNRNRIAVPVHLIPEDLQGGELRPWWNYFSSLPTMDIIKSWFFLILSSSWHFSCSISFASLGSFLTSCSYLLSIFSQVFNSFRSLSSSLLFRQLFICYRTVDISSFSFFMLSEQCYQHLVANYWQISALADSEISGWSDILEKLGRNWELFAFRYNSTILFQLFFIAILSTQIFQFISWQSKAFPKLSLISFSFFTFPSIKLA